MALYYDLLVFKEAYKLILVLFGVTKDFPKEYKYSLGHGIKRDGICNGKITHCHIYFASNQQEQKRIKNI
jgi:hypothetical protein